MDPAKNSVVNCIAQVVETLLSLRFFSLVAQVQSRRVSLAPHSFATFPISCNLSSVAAVQPINIHLEFTIIQAGRAYGICTVGLIG